MVTTKKDAIDLEKQIQALKDNPGKRGPNDLEQRIEDLTNINKSHLKLNGLKIPIKKKKSPVVVHRDVLVLINTL